MSKFTPGPWNVKNATDVFTRPGAPNGEGLHADSNDAWRIADCNLYLEGASVMGEATPLSDAERRANARLIAAAPELYGALAELVEQCGHPNISGWVNIERAIAALAKATGKPASRCGCGGLCDPGHPCPMAYAAE